MLFKKKEKKPEEVGPPTPIDGGASTCTDMAGEEGTAADGSKAKELNNIHTDIVYPSGLKLALLMMSIFVGMFLVSLVR